MTDKGRKLEDHSGAVKASRGHTPSHQHHQLTTPAAAPGFYTIPADVTGICRHAPPHHHLGAYHLPPSYMPHPLTIQGAIQTGPGRPGTASISNDLGPPIFMPSLNLGTPKSVKGRTPPTTVSSGQVNVSHDSVSSPGTNEFSHNTIMCHTPFPNQSMTGVVKTPGIKMAVQPSMNSVRKVKMDSMTSKASLMTHPHAVTMKQSERNSPSPISSYPPNNLTSIGLNPAGGMSISLVKPTIVNSSVAMSEMPGGSHVTYVTPTSHYHNVMPYGTMSGAKPESGFEPSPLHVSKPEGGGVTVMTLASGVGGGATLVCTERLSPPIPHITASSMSTVAAHSSSSSSEQQRYERVRPPIVNHYPHEVLTDYSTGGGGGEHIPWPEAMSKTIIIPAPNLTGKDIANLTSSASSSPLSNDKGTNDIHWPTTPTDQPYSDENFADASEGQNSPPTQSNHLLDSNTGATSLFGMSHVIQGSSSPRPSILRKRPLERSSDSLLSLSPTTTGHTLLSRLPPSSKPNLLCNELSTSLHDNHMTLDTSSPRKRPRKQQFDSINNSHSPSSSSVNSQKLSLMVAHERLPGPVPLKNKDRQHYSGRVAEGKPTKELERLYISQLRKPQYPIGYLCKRSHRPGSNHLRRYSDIKHHEELPVSLHELCSADDTWLRSSGWKLQHLNSHLNEMEGLENDTLKLISDLECATSKVLNSLPKDTLTDSNHKFLEDLILDTKERTRRSLLHIQETRQNMFKVLDTNEKVTEIMKKFADCIPVSPTISSTTIPLSSQD